MRGFEQIFIDFIENPDIVNEIMKRVTDFYVEYFKRILEMGGEEIDLVFTADDIAGQKRLLMSIKMWEEFIKPHHVRLNKTIHEFGVKNVMEAVDGLIEME